MVYYNLGLIFKVLFIISVGYMVVLIKVIAEILEHCSITIMTSGKKHKCSDNQTSPRTYTNGSQARRPLEINLYLPMF